MCERLFEELVKELLKDRFTVVSGSFREIDGRKVRVRKAHLRKRKRWRQIAFWSALGLMPLLSIRVSQWESFLAWGTLPAIDSEYPFLQASVSASQVLRRTTAVWGYESAIGLYDYRTIVFGSESSIWSGKQDVLSYYVFAKCESILRPRRTVFSLYRTIEI